MCAVTHLQHVFYKLLGGLVFITLAFLPLSDIRAFDGPKQQDVAQRMWLAASWRQYKAKYVSLDGRVIDNANGNISHTEGQGYGMLLAVYMDDRSTFQSLRRYSRENLRVRGDELFAWKIDPSATPPVTDTNNATDGDLLIAWALLEASERWGESSYKEEAFRILEDIKKEDIVVVPSIGPVLLPGSEGFGSQKAWDNDEKITLNLSYWVFPALEKIAQVTMDSTWSDLAGSGEKLLSISQFAPSFLPPDWIDLSNKAEVAPSSRFEKVFGYNAVRIPLYLAASSSAERRRLAGTYADIFGASFDYTPFVTDISTARGLRAMVGSGYALVSALSSCVEYGSRIPDVFLKFNDDYYYNSTLQLLSFIVISEEYSSCLDAN